MFIVFGALNSVGPWTHIFQVPTVSPIPLINCEMIALLQISISAITEKCFELSDAPFKDKPVLSTRVSQSVDIFLSIVLFHLDSLPCEVNA